MKRIAVLTLGLALCATLTLGAQDKKAAAPNIAGTYKLVGGKKDGQPVNDDAKKGTYTIDAKTITISDGEGKFVITYKLNASAKPVAIDMEIVEAPVADAKGMKGYGIVELNGDTLKLAYGMDKDSRPKDFTGDKGHSFELKKQKGKGKKKKDE
jgi:uncharacterized protein (TIGR03067 family)